MAFLFKKLDVYRLACEFVREAAQLTERFGPKQYALSDQLQRASISISANIAEGYEHDTPAEFHRFLVMAKASCAEVRSQLYLAKEIGYLGPRDFQRLFGFAEELARIIGGLKAAVKASRDK